MELRYQPGERLPHPVEGTAYHIVAEALTNVAKYAGASAATVSVIRTDGRLLVRVRDAGVGGADMTRGSGLRGLADRAEALRGRSGSRAPPSAAPSSAPTFPSPVPRSSHWPVTRIGGSPRAG